VLGIEEVLAQLQEAPMHDGPTMHRYTYTVDLIRTMLSDAPGGMVASAIQRKFTDTHGVSKRLQNFLDERCNVKGCWTRRLVPTYRQGNETGNFKTRYFPN
jgi:hypothetical protein